MDNSPLGVITKTFEWFGLEALTLPITIFFVIWFSTIYFVFTFFLVYSVQPDVLKTDGLNPSVLNSFYYPLSIPVGFTLGFLYSDKVLDLDRCDDGVHH